MEESSNPSVFASLGKYLGGKVVTALLIVAVGLIGVYFWRNPDKLEDLWGTIRSSLIWLGFVAVLPWALFFMPGWILKFESNSAAAILLVAYLICDILMAMWLADWHIEGSLTWGVVIVGFLVAGIYNFLVCDSLAEWSDEMS